MVEQDGLPTIPWAQIEDDHSDEHVGYSFLSDNRNTWVKQGHDWVFSRLRQSPAIRRR